MKYHQELRLVCLGLWLWGNALKRFRFEISLLKLLASKPLTKKRVTVGRWKWPDSHVRSAWFQFNNVTCFKVIVHNNLLMGSKKWHSPTNKKCSVASTTSNRNTCCLLRCSKRITPECSTLRLNRQLALRSTPTACSSLQPLTESITDVSRWLSRMNRSFTTNAFCGSGSDASGKMSASNCALSLSHLSLCQAAR